MKRKEINILYTCTHMWAQTFTFTWGGAEKPLLHIHSNPSKGRDQADPWQNCFSTQNCSKLGDHLKTWPRFKPKQRRNSVPRYLWSHPGLWLSNWERDRRDHHHHACPRWGQIQAARVRTVRSGNAPSFTSQQHLTVSWRRKHGGKPSKWHKLCF